MAGEEELPRRIRQPGPPAAERIVAVEGAGRPLRLDLPAGVTLLEAVRRGLASQGFAGGTAALRDLALGPFAYVMPALSATPEHAAYYSDVFRPAGTTRLQHGAMSFGRRDGAPFFHAHACWTEAEGRRSGGHILPEETWLAEPATVEAFGFAGGVFEARHDPETNFTLFGPVPAPRGEASAASRAIALRLRPNEDVATLLEGFAAAHGIARARIHGGVGSIIGARFADGQVVRRFATEAWLRAGHIAPGAAGAPEAALDVALVDDRGGLAEGRLRRGDNPVLMTFEMVLEVLG